MLSNSSKCIFTGSYTLSTLPQSSPSSEVLSALLFTVVSNYSSISSAGSFLSSAFSGSLSCTLSDAFIDLRVIAIERLIFQYSIALFFATFNCLFFSFAFLNVWLCKDAKLLARVGLGFVLCFTFYCSVL